MNLKFTFRHMEASEAVKTLISKKVEKLGKIVTYPVEYHITCSADKLEHTVEIDCRAEHKTLSAKATTTDLYESLDGAIHKLETQLKKEREKRKGHHSGHQMARDNEHLAADVMAELPHSGKNNR